MMLSSRQKYLIVIVSIIIVVFIMAWFLTKKESYGGAVYTSKAIDRSQIMKRKALNYPRPGSGSLPDQIPIEVPQMMQEQPMPKDPMRHMSVRKEMFSNEFEPPRKDYKATERKTREISI